MLISVCDHRRRTNRASSMRGGVAKPSWRAFIYKSENPHPVGAPLDMAASSQASRQNIRKGVRIDVVCALRLLVGPEKRDQCEHERRHCRRTKTKLNCAARSHSPAHAFPTKL